VKKFTAEERAELRALADRAREWIESPEGRAALAEVLEKAAEAGETLVRAQRLDWRAMEEPFTI
jgi:hypothetical protein